MSILNRFQSLQPNGPLPSFRSVITMTLTKKRKKILLIALPAAVVVIAAAMTAAVLLLSRFSSVVPWQLQNISQYNGTGKTEYAIANGWSPMLNCLNPCLLRIYSAGRIHPH